jgi:hypothetical protein
MSQFRATVSVGPPSAYHLPGSAPDPTELRDPVGVSTAPG